MKNHPQHPAGIEIKQWFTKYQLWQKLVVNTEAPDTHRYHYN
jgi:hypothetical protein